VRQPEVLVGAHEHPLRAVMPGSSENAPSASALDAALLRSRYRQSLASKTSDAQIEFAVPVALATQALMKVRFDRTSARGFAPCRALEALRCPPVTDHRFVRLVE